MKNNIWRRFLAGMLALVMAMSNISIDDNRKMRKLYISVRF